MSKYTIGYDYGSLSVRALLVDLGTGEEICDSEYVYPHGVMEKELPDGTALGIDWALQHPQDYLDGFVDTTRAVLEKSGVDPQQVIGIGIDFTSCTILPTLKDGTPLCFLPEYQNQPHAYVKLWKHHAAQYCADILNDVAEKMDQPWLSLYGGKISCEWVVPKAMQIAKEAPDIYRATERIIEAGDWVIWMLCGKETRSACNAGYKALWHHKNGYPDKAFFKALDPLMENFVSEKLSEDIHPLGEKAGNLTPEMAKLTGLSTNTAVAVETVDAHASVPACTIADEGKMLMIMGTSTCHMLLSKTERGVPGTCGIVKDGIIPGFYGYEAGQSCVGDHFAWFVDRCLPADYYEAAKEKGLNIHQYLREKAQVLKPGESGLLALDWWNGVRSTLMDFDLSGMLLGMTLQTKPEEIYRALIEATAYGTRVIIEAFEAQGIAVNELYAAGGIANKDPMMMQIYADICGKTIHISGSGQSGALGSAIFAAAAAGSENGGFHTVEESAKRLGKLKDTVYQPVAENAAVYEKLYCEYKKLYHYFGRGENSVMKRLKDLKLQYAK